jgi:hypothetical protein
MDCARHSQAPGANASTPQGISAAASPSGRSSAEDVITASLAGCAMQRADGDQILVSNRAHICFVKGHQSLSASRSGNELNLEATILIHLDYGTEVTAAESVLQQVSVEDDGIKKLERHDDLSRESSHESWQLLAYKSDPNRNDGGSPARRPYKRSTTLVLLAERACLAKIHLFGRGNSEQVVAQHNPLVGTVAESHEEAGLETANRVRRGE